MSAVDLEITLRAAGPHYAATVQCTPTASSAPIDTSATPALIAIDQARLHALALDPRAYGLALGQMVLADPLLTRVVAQARAIAQQREVPLRVRLTLAADAAELHTLRWEALRDPDAPDSPLLTAGGLVSFSRYLSSADWQPVRLHPSGPQRALAVLACPSDLADYHLTPFDLDAEGLLIERSLGALPATVLAQGQATLDTLTEHLRDGYDILYLLAHGRSDETGETWLYLEGQDGLTRPVRGSELATRIAELRVRPQMVILGSCESAGDGHGPALLALGPRLAQVGVGAVLAMQDRITVETLGRFLPACLRAFQRDGQIDAAVAAARGTVRERPDFWVPVLFLRVPNGRLWDTLTETSLRRKIEERLHTTRAALRVLLAQVQAAEPDAPLPPQLRASITQLQQRIADDKASLRGAGSAAADAPEDAAALPHAPAATGLATPRRLPQPASGEPASDPYAQYRAYLLRLLPPLEAHAQPYQGLQTFQFEHADRFFGRDALVAELAERLGRAPFLAVLGASGSGKSSLVRAGLLPLLKAGGLPGSERWRYVVITPGAHPLDALAAALSEASGSSLSETLALARELAADAGTLLLLARRFAPRLVLVVDQAEELWTLQPSDAQQRALWQEQQQQPFLRLLLSGLGVPDRPLAVVLAMRADFLHRAGADSALARAISDHVVLVSRMSADELRAAVELPARQAGGRFEPGLVDELVAQAQGEDGSLPLLEYTLQELWAQRGEDGLMTWACYRALGGVEGALAKRADGILQRHYTPAQQDEVRRVLLRLIQPGEGAADTRRRVALADLAARDQPPDALHSLIQPLIDARLLTTGQERGQPAMVEVSHEALIRSWPTLRGWIDEARADLRLQIQLEEAAREWRASGGDASLLWDGLRLSNAEAWLQRAQPGLSARDATFLEASRAEAQRQAQASTRAKRDRRLLAVAAPLLLVAVIASVVAFISQRQVAAANDLIDAQRLAYAAQSQQVDTPEIALLLASEAAKRVANPITEQALRDALDRYSFRVRVFIGHSQSVWHVAFNADGTRIITASDDTTARVWSTDGESLAILQGHTQSVRSAKFSADGARVVTASADKTARVWSTDGKSLAILQGHTDWVNSAVFSPDDTRIVTASDDGTARLWSREGQELATLQGHTDRVVSAQFSPDGTRIVTVSDDGTTRVWSVDGRLLAILQGHTQSVWSAQFSADGTRIVTASDDGMARVWSADGRLLAILQGHTQSVWSAAFSADGAHIVTASDDGTARVWRADGRLLAILQSHTDRVRSAAFSPDGTRIVTASADKTARVWSANGSMLFVLQRRTASVQSAQFSPDSARIVTASWEGAAHVWSTDGKPLATLQGHTNTVRSALFSPDGARIATASSDGTARVWSADGKPLAILQGHTNIVQSAQFSPDGARIVTASKDKTARVWTVEGSPLATLQGHTDIVQSAQFSPDGTRIATASSDGTARVWTVEGSLLATLQDHTNIVQSAQFSPDGTRIVTASTDKTARVWTVEGRWLATLQGHTGGVVSAQFSPNGTRIVTASTDGTARLWTTDGELLTVLQGHTHWVQSAEFSLDGAHIVTASDDQTARIWSADGKPLSILHGHTGVVLGAEFSPDGTRIVSASADGTVQVSPVRAADLLAIAACRLPRNLTDEEIGRFEVGAARFDRAAYQCPP